MLGVEITVYKYYLIMQLSGLGQSNPPIPDTQLTHMLL